MTGKSDKGSKQLHDNQDNKIKQLQKQVSELKKSVREHKKREEAALDKETWYQTLFEYTGDAIFLETDLGTIVEVNERVCELFGYTREELLKLKSSQLYRSSEPYPSVYSNPALGGEHPVEMTGIRRDGHELSLEYTITPLISARNTVFMYIIRDITERKLAEKALQESEEKYRTILESIEDGYYEVDIDGKITFFNSSLCEIIGYAEKDVIGLSYKEFTDTDNAVKLDKFFNEIVKKGEVTKGYEWEIIRQDNTKRDVESSLSLIKDMDSVTGFRGILRDVSDRKSAENELKMIQNHLMESKKMAALGELVAGVAHEINTPIGIGVTGMSTLEERTKEIFRLYDKDDLTKEEFENFLKTVSEASFTVLSNLQRAAELISTFKQVAVDQSSEEQRSFKLKDYISDTLLSMRPRLKKTKHTIVVNCPEDLEFTSYPGAIARIVTNLLMNSLIHGFDGIEKGEIVFDISVKDNYVLFRYKDNGNGIEDETRDKIFDPFFTTKRGQGGAGLGMHIVYNLVTQTLNGQIECSGKLGEGTDFLITIPLQ